MKKLTKLFAMVLLSTTVLGSISMPVYANTPVSVSDPAPIVPLADIIDWVYKLEDGLLYKRLYNHTKQVFIGDWILVG